MAAMLSQKPKPVNRMFIWRKLERTQMPKAKRAGLRANIVEVEEVLGRPTLLGVFPNAAAGQLV
jgi:hypothetical protein